MLMINFSGFLINLIFSFLISLFSMLQIVVISVGINITSSKQLNWTSIMVSLFMKLLMRNILRRNIMLFE